MSGKRTRRQFLAERKAEVVRRRLVGKEAVSDLADELQVQPTQIHLWIKQVLDQAEAAFTKTPGGKQRAPSEHDRRARCDLRRSSASPGRSRSRHRRSNGSRQQFTPKRHAGILTRKLQKAVLHLRVSLQFARESPAAPGSCLRVAGFSRVLPRNNSCR